MPITSVRIRTSWASIQMPYFSHPLLVMAGFPRGGSTSFYRNLREHPGFAVSLRKEFNALYQADPAQTYATHFSGRQVGQVCADVSPIYCMDPSFPARLKTVAPDAKVFVCVREPAAWILSLYSMICSFVLRPPTFRDFASSATFDYAPVPLPLNLAKGFYRSQLHTMAQAFGDNLLIGDFALFSSDPLAVYQAVEEFSGALPYFTAETVDPRAHNSSRIAEGAKPLVRHLASKEIFIRPALKLLPASLLEFVRSKLYYAADNGSTEFKSRRYDDQDAQFARELTAADRETYSGLFLEKPFLRGTEILSALAHSPRAHLPDNIQPLC